MTRILVIDDDSHIRTSVAQALTKAGYEVQVTSSGREGIRINRVEPFDLVIVDLFMPDQDGLETITQIRGEFPQIALIAMSGGYAVSGTMLSVAQELGAVKVLEKPFDSALLLHSVEEVLQAA